MRKVNQAVIFAAGHGSEGGDEFDWASLARTGQPIVLYMAMHRLDDIAGALMRGGLSGDTPAAAIAAATLPEQRIHVSTLANLASDLRAQKFEPPAIVVVGHVVAERQRLLGFLAEAAQ